MHGAGNALKYQLGNAFSTRDQDNDVHADHCARVFHGAWWYSRCHYCNLNGGYQRGNGTTQSYADSVVWATWKGFFYSLRYVEMKIKPYTTSKTNKT